MSLLEIVSEYCKDGDTAEKAVFDVAMKDKIENQGGYKLSDMLYELFVCQKELHILSCKVESLTKAKSAPATKKTERK